VNEEPVRIADLPTPLMTLCEPDLRENIERFAHWCRELGLLHAPHGKTTMAPSIWRQQVEAGAWAITVANGRQLDVAVQSGIDRVMVANELVDPASARSLARAVAGGTWVCAWVDSVAGVALLDEGLRDAGLDGRLPVLLEMGVAGGRCGVRTTGGGGRAVAVAVAASKHLALAGVAGFEGVLGGARTPQNETRVRRFVEELVALQVRCDDLLPADTVLISAGGSVWFDVVAEELAGVAAADPRIRPVLRSGGYVTHDHGYYAEHGPGSAGVGPRLVPALRVWARVLSVPERGVAHLGAGKRDVPYDEGLPRVLNRWDGRSGEPRSLGPVAITATFDQHARMEYADEGPAVGDIVELGISHPCTAFDKWRSVMIVGANDPRSVVVGSCPTYF
jgi:D-serine deaminase-like pyridoxal phosphate-dependent protein